MNGKVELTAETLRKQLDYDPTTGAFTRRCGSSRWPAGRRTGTPNVKGYIYIKLGKKLYYAHRLAWLYVHGRWPTEIDHINQYRWDNRLVNLREVTRSENLRNSRRKLGLRGIRRRGRILAGNSWNTY